MFWMHEHPFRSLDPLQHRQYTYQAVTRLLLSESRVQPVVVVFEDLHWNDSLTLGLLNELVVGAQDARLLLVASYRPDYRDEWKNRPNYHQLRLDPLASESLAELLQALLGSDPSLSILKSLPGGARQRESVLRRRDRAVAGRYRRARGRARQLPPCEAVLQRRGPTHRAGGARRAYRRACRPPKSACCRRRPSLVTTSHWPSCTAICGLTEDKLRGLLDNLQAAEFLYVTQLFPDAAIHFQALPHPRRHL